MYMGHSGFSIFLSFPWKPCILWSVSFDPNSEILYLKLDWEGTGNHYCYSSHTNQIELNRQFNLPPPSLPPSLTHRSSPYNHAPPFNPSPSPKPLNPTVDFFSSLVSIFLTSDKKNLSSILLLFFSFYPLIKILILQYFFLGLLNQHSIFPL